MGEKLWSPAISLPLPSEYIQHRVWQTILEEKREKMWTFCVCFVLCFVALQAFLMLFVALPTATSSLLQRCAGYWTVLHCERGEPGPDGWRFLFKVFYWLCFYSLAEWGEPNTISFWIWLHWKKDCIPRVSLLFKLMTVSFSFVMLVIHRSSLWKYIKSM